MSETATMERRAYRLTGHVQGVGFRWWTRETASGMGLRGTVRNAADGSVEIEVEGPEEALADFETQLQHGPSSARVRGVEREEPEGGELPGGFEIVR